ncbi:MAG: cell division protein FtsQ/DivIB [Bacillota bacterium]
MTLPGRDRTGRKSRKPFFVSGLLFMVICITALYFFVHSSIFAITRIKVQGNESLTGKDVVQLAAVPLGLNIFQANLSQSRENLLLNPMVEDALVSRQLPSTVIVVLKERKPQALLATESGFIEIDRRGVYLRKIEEISSLPLVVITGVKVPGGIGPGQVIKADNLDIALKLLGEIKEGADLITELDVKDPVGIKFYTRENVEVLLGFPERIENKMHVFNDIYKNELSSGQAGQIEYIDVSFKGNPVVKFRTK